MANYIPSRELDLLDWTANLKTQLEASPLAYGMDADQVDAYAVLQLAFASAYAVANDPLTRNKPSIKDKNDAKAALLGATRPLVQTLQNWSGMTDGKRETLQIPVRDYDPTPVGPPEEMPVLLIAAVNGQVVDLDLRQADGTTKTKPAGVRSVWLYSHAGESPPTSLALWKFEGGSTKSNPQIVFPDSVTPGTPVYLTASWVNPTDQPGPACAPVKTHINYVGLNQAA